jgi:hypothetical protein
MISSLPDPNAQPFVGEPLPDAIPDAGTPATPPPDNSGLLTPFGPQQAPPDGTTPDATQPAGNPFPPQPGDATPQVSPAPPQSATPDDMNALTNPPSNGQIPAGSQQDVCASGANCGNPGPAATLPNSSIPATNTDYGACNVLTTDLARKDCINNAYYQGNQGATPPKAAPGWQPAAQYVAPVAPADINSLPVGTEVSAIPTNPDGTLQDGWVVDAQQGPNYGHYIRQTDAAASECSASVGDAQTACINSAMTRFATGNNLGAGANLDCFHNPTELGCAPMPAVKDYVNTNTNTSTTLNSGQSAYGVTNPNGEVIQGPNHPVMGSH